MPMSVLVVQERAYLSKEGHARLDSVMADQRRLYNAALLQRRYAYEGSRVRLDLRAQSRELTDVRAHDPRYEDVDRRVQAATLTRLDKAYNSQPDTGRRQAWVVPDDCSVWGWGNWHAREHGWFLYRVDGLTAAEVCPHVWVIRSVRLSSVTHLIQASSRPSFLKTTSTGTLVTFLPSRDTLNQ